MRQYFRDFTGLRVVGWGLGVIMMLDGDKVKKVYEKVMSDVYFFFWINEMLNVCFFGMR